MKNQLLSDACGFPASGSLRREGGGRPRPCCRGPPLVLSVIPSESKSLVLWRAYCSPCWAPKGGAAVDQRATQKMRTGRGLNTRRYSQKIGQFFFCGRVYCGSARVPFVLLLKFKTHLDWCRPSGLRNFSLQCQ